MLIEFGWWRGWMGGRVNLVLILGGSVWEGNRGVRAVDETGGCFWEEKHFLLLYFKSIFYPKRFFGHVCGFKYLPH
jgi:hypothetical protein